jgi:signal transduction histidine kinase
MLKQITVEPKQELAALERENAMLLIELATLRASLVGDRIAVESAMRKERNRLAQEIHDTLAQALTGVVMHLETAKVVIPLDSQAQTHIIQAQKLARTGLAETRRSVWGLRPQLLQGGNLCSAISHLVEQLNQYAPITIKFRVLGVQYPLTEDIEINLLRIAQEALTNALKHAMASTIYIELAFATGYIELIVGDNGQGFNVNAIANQEGFGLICLGDRAQSIGGKLTISSQSGQGTTILVVVLTS